MQILDSDNNLLAMLINLDNDSQRSEFFTDNTLDFQAALFNLKKGEEIKRHIHKKNVRQISSTTEAIYVINGKIQVGVYDNEKIFVNEVEVNTNELILLFNGGHSMNVIKDTKFFEIKQGPYVEEDDKERF